MATIIETRELPANSYGQPRRMVTIADTRNTAGQQEVYQVIFDGTFNDGTDRVYVRVQRPDGSFAHLNGIKHHKRIAMAARLAKQAEAA